MTIRTATDIAVPFDDTQQQRHAAILGIWIFLTTEVLFFGGLFVGYAVYRFQYFEAFEAGSRRLNLWTGAIMTAVLLLGSLLVAVSEHLIEQHEPSVTNDADKKWLRRRLVTRLAVTALLGVVFLALETYEYSELIRAGLFPGTGFELSLFADSLQQNRSVEMFFVLFFFMTGLHACHMMVGISLITWIAIMLQRTDRLHRLRNALTIVGLYWHFVDIVWIFLYPLFYLVR